MILVENGVGREPTDMEECTPTRELIQWLFERGYMNAWLEDTDQGVVIHGISLGVNPQGPGDFVETIVPESWMNK